MPLTDAGEKVKANMTKQYGPVKGEQVLYASMNKGNPGSGKWHAKRKATKGRSSMGGKR